MTFQNWEKVHLCILKEVDSWYCQYTCFKLFSIFKVEWIVDEEFQNYADGWSHVQIIMHLLVVKCVSLSSFYLRLWVKSTRDWGEKNGTLFFNIYLW